MAKSIADILVGQGAITPSAAQVARRRARAEKRPLEDVLTDLGTSEDTITRAKSAFLGLPIRSIGGKKIPFEVLKLIPEEAARTYRFAPLGEAEGMIEVGMVNPDDAVAQEALKFIASRLGRSFRVFLLSPSEYTAAVEQYKGLGGEVTAALSAFREEVAEESKKLAARGATKPQDEGARIVEDAPISKMVSVIMRHAVEGRASDIHIEPVEKHVRVRFRVDGVLHTSLLLPLEVHSAVISRIKILSNLKIEETRMPQDGRIHIPVMDKPIDFRVATFPTSFGEKVALRILAPEVGVRTLPDLGLAGRNLELVERAIRRPYGMILISGPTGSGKSTTLYALMSRLNDESRNIVSLEDPVEYHMAGVNQSQVRPEIGYDFASGLRQILRQDPDIIMVGEIRDKETAKLAVHAALTGHLVLSTIHTNNAVGIIPRLLDMGVDPFLIPSTLIAGLAQRLTRRLCPDSREATPESERGRAAITAELDTFPQAMREGLALIAGNPIYEGKPSPSCPKGTKGRIAVFEAIEMTPELSDIIISGPTEQKIIAEAERQGMATMRQDGIIKVLEGTIGMKELFEVV